MEDCWVGIGVEFVFGNCSDGLDLCEDLLDILLDGVVSDDLNDLLSFGQRMMPLQDVAF